MKLSKIQRDIYLAQRAVGDARAAQRGPEKLAKRVVRRRVTRAVFRLFR